MSDLTNQIEVFKRDLADITDTTKAIFGELDATLKQIEADVAKGDFSGLLNLISNPDRKLVELPTDLMGLYVGLFDSINKIDTPSGGIFSWFSWLFNMSKDPLKSWRNSVARPFKKKWINH